MKDLLIGLDIGTSSVKAGLFDFSGKRWASARYALTISSPAPGWAEEDPDEWWVGACQTIRQVLDGVDPARIAGLGLCGQCPGHVLVDRQAEALRPAIIWRDQRAKEEALWLREHISYEQAMQWTGSLDLSDVTLPPARLLWLKFHCPDEWKKTFAVLNPKDYIGMRLTQRIGTDLHSAFCLVNPETMQYSPEFLDVLDIPPAILPTVFRPTDELGSISLEAASQTKLPPGTPVTVGTIDAWCDNLACGAILPGRAVDICGTSEMVSLGVEVATSNLSVFLASLGEKACFLCGPTQAGGDTLRWLYQGFYSQGAHQVDFSSLELAASSIPPGSEGVIFLPYLSGERAPVWDANARAAWFGLSFNHHRDHCTRAVYEGVGYAVRHILEACEQAAVIRADVMVCCGGGSASKFWNQIKADILQRPVQPCAYPESACLGAAMLSGLGNHFFCDLRSACAEMSHLGQAQEPNRENAEIYETGYQNYQDLYPTLKSRLWQ